MSKDSKTGNPQDIRLFHTDRGNEFKNRTIEELLKTFDIERSLSHKGLSNENKPVRSKFLIRYNKTNPECRRICLTVYSFCVIFDI